MQDFITYYEKIAYYQTQLAREGRIKSASHKHSIPVGRLPTAPHPPPAPHAAGMINSSIQSEPSTWLWPARQRVRPHQHHSVAPACRTENVHVT